MGFYYILCPRARYISVIRIVFGGVVLADVRPLLKCPRKSETIMKGH